MVSQKVRADTAPQRASRILGHVLRTRAYAQATFWRRAGRAVFSGPGLVILCVAVAGVIVWALLRSDAGPAVPTDGLRSAEVTVNGTVTYSQSLDAKQALSVADAINSLPQSHPGSGTYGCGMDQGFTDTVVFRANTTTQAVIDMGACFPAVTVGNGSAQRVLDDRSGSAISAVQLALRTPTG
jgi:hypothetical protein